MSGKVFVLVLKLVLDMVSDLVAEMVLDMVSLPGDLMVLGMVSVWVEVTV